MKSRIRQTSPIRTKEMGAVIMRKGSGTRRTAARRFASVMAAVGALLVSSGIALMAAPAPAHADECVPSAAYTETTDWVDASPGVGWYQVDERQVLVTEGTEPVYGPGQRYSWNPQGPYDESAGAPAWPTPSQGKWTANTDAYLPGHDGEPIGVVFQQGGGNQGDNASWFYWEKVEVTPGTAPVYRAEFKFSFDHPAVTCPTVEPPTTPQVSPPKAHVKTHVKAEATTPTVVHAGLAGSTVDTSTQAALALTAAGLLLLTGAGGLVLVGGGDRK